MCAKPTTTPFHQVALLYVSIGIKDRLSSAVTLALVLATFVASSIFLVELVGFEKPITVYTIMLHIWLLTALGWVSRVRVGASPQRGLGSVYFSITMIRSLVEKYGFSAYIGMVAHIR